jgi:hypothetical protein
MVKQHDRLDSGTCVVMAILPLNMCYFADYYDVMVTELDCTAFHSDSLCPPLEHCWEAN